MVARLVSLAIAGISLSLAAFPFLELAERLF